MLVENNQSMKKNTHLRPRGCKWHRLGQRRVPRCCPLLLSLGVIIWGSCQQKPVVMETRGGWVETGGSTENVRQTKRVKF